MQYSGTRLFWTGFLVCRDCLDTPQHQLLTPILPGDPKPLVNPRPEYFDQDRGQDGFALYTLWAPDIGAMRSESQLAQTKASMLAQVALLSGVPTPSGYSDESGVLTTANVAQQITAFNGAREWLVLFNPGAVPIVFSTGTAAFSADPFAVLLGAGCAALSTTAPQPATGGADDERGGLPTLYTGALTAVAQIGAQFGASSTSGDFGPDFGPDFDQNKQMTILTWAPSYWLFEFPVAGGGFPPVPVFAP